MKLEFTKEVNGNWYIVLPNWTGNHEDLQMVMGADTMLDILAGEQTTVKLTVSETTFPAASHLQLVKLCENVGGGDYLLREYQGETLNLEMWLCGVTEYVFGYMPPNLYFQKI